ncbi:MAG: hypothetical protein KAJ44_00490 [Thermoplasmatales archaeon]|nr:hypothetical protein [Thermoplasmatales archaeon]
MIKNTLIVSIIIFTIITPITLASNIKSEVEPLDEEHPRERMWIVGRYASLEIIDNKIPKNLEIRCQREDITVFGVEWIDWTHFPPSYVRFHLIRQTHFIAPKFYGYCGNNIVFGITFGDFAYYF